MLYTGVTWLPHGCHMGVIWKPTRVFLPLPLKLECPATTKLTRLFYLVLFQHCLEADMRDDPAVPCNGYNTRLTQEVAGLGGDVFFSKSEMQTEFFKEIYNKWVIGRNESSSNNIHCIHITVRFLSLTHTRARAHTHN